MRRSFERIEGIMWRLEEINEDNVEVLKDFLGEDNAENLSREYFNGLVSYDPSDEPVSAVIWCLKNPDDFDDTESELFFFSSVNDEDGEELLREYTERIKEDNVIRSFFEFENTFSSSEKIMKDSGFSIRKHEGRNLYATLGEITGMKFAALKKNPPYIRSIGSISTLQFRQGVNNCMFSGMVGLNDDVAMLPMEWYENDISCCILTDDKVNGFFLIHRKPSGALMPVLLYASGVDARKEMLNMMRFSVNAARSKYPPETEVIISRHDDNTKALAAYLFPGRKGREVMSGERMEQSLTRI